MSKEEIVKYDMKFIKIIDKVRNAHTVFIMNNYNGAKFILEDAKNKIELLINELKTMDGSKKNE